MAIVAIPVAPSLSTTATDSDAKYVIVLLRGREQSDHQRR